MPNVPVFIRRLYYTRVPPREYYIDSSAPSGGNGSYTSPWNSVATVNALPGASMIPGNIYNFTGSFRETLIPPVSGIENAPIIFRVYGNGATLDGTTPVTGWVNHSGEVWKKTSFTEPAGSPSYLMLFENGVRLRQLTAIPDGEPDSNPGDQASFYLDDAADTLYVQCSDGGDPNAKTMLWSVTSGQRRGIRADGGSLAPGRNWLEFDGFTLYGWSQHGFSINHTSAVTAPWVNYITARNITAAYCGVQGFRVYVPTTDAINYVTIQDCLAHHTNGEGIWCSGTNTDVDTCVSHNNGLGKVTLGWSALAIAGSIILGIRSKYNRVHGCTVYVSDQSEYFGDGLVLTPSCNSLIDVENENSVRPLSCQVYDNIAYDPGGPDVLGTGITFLNSGQDTLLYNNIFRQNLAQNCWFNTNGGGGAASGTKAYNNVFYMQNATGAFCISISTVGGEVDFRNNIVRSSTASGGRHISLPTAGEAASTFDNNIWADGQASPFRVESVDRAFSYWQATLGNDANGFSTTLASVGWTVDPPTAFTFLPDVDFLGLDEGVAIGSVVTDRIGVARSDPPDVGPYELEAVEYIYYIQNGGSDGAAGSLAAPWANVSKITNYAGSYPVRFRLARGSTWEDGLVFPGSGTPSHYCTIEAYGSGANPLLDGSTALSSWTLESGTPGTDAVYSCAWSSSSSPNEQVFQIDSGTILRLRRSASYPFASGRGRFYHNDGANRMYVRCWDGASPTTANRSLRSTRTSSTDAMRGVKAGSTFGNGYNYWRVENIDARMFAQEGFSVRQYDDSTSNITYVGCNSSWNGVRGYTSYVPATGNAHGSNNVRPESIHYINCTASDNMGEGIWVSCGDGLVDTCSAINNGLGRDEMGYSFEMAGAIIFGVRSDNCIMSNCTAYITKSGTMNQGQADAVNIYIPYCTSLFDIECEAGLVRPTDCAIVSCFGYNPGGPLGLGGAICLKNSGERSLIANNICVQNSAQNCYTQTNGGVTPGPTITYVYNNIFWMSAAAICCNFSDNGGPIDFRNNIVRCPEMVSGRFLSIGTTNESGSTFNYNIWIGGQNSSSNQNGWRVGGTDRTKSVWQGTYGNDANSLFDNLGAGGNFDGLAAVGWTSATGWVAPIAPSYTGTATNFTPGASFVGLNAGVAIAAVTDDFNGVSRGSPPEIGVFEKV